MGTAGTTVKPKPMGPGHADDFQTDPAALDCLMPILDTERDWRIWEPAMGKGNLVEHFIGKGFPVYGSDIRLIEDRSSWDYSCAEFGELDFLSAVPPRWEWDCIVTNPPYSCKEAFLRRALELGKPFAFLVRESIFDSKERRKLLEGRDVTLVLPDGRVKFTTPNGTYGGAWFYTYWLCVGFGLGRGIIFPQEGR